MRVSPFGRGLSLVTLGLVVVPLLVHERPAEPGPPARLALPSGALPSGALPSGALPSGGTQEALETTLRPPDRRPPSASPPAEVVLRVRPWTPPELRDAGTPLTPPPYPLLIPVVGVRPDDLADTFDDARDSARVHRAIDILAPVGTPVVAAVGGHVIRRHTSPLGGLTVYQVGPDSAWVLYYAHLDRYADGLRPGQAVAQGDTLGYVGETGNAPVPHLHFAVWKARPGSRRLWGGRAINPYPLLRASPFTQP